MSNAGRKLLKVGGQASLPLRSLRLQFYRVTEWSMLQTGTVTFRDV